MRRTIGPFCACLVAYVLLAGAASASAPTTGILGYWPGHGSAGDLSLNGNDGALVGNAGYDSTAEPYYSTGTPLAFHFDGNDPTSVSIPNSPGLDSAQTGSWSISAWLKPDGAQGGQVWIFGQNQGPQLVLDGTHAVLQYADGSSVFQKVTSSAAIPAGVWTSIAGTWDGTTLKLYVNGSLDNSATPGVPPGPEVGCAWHIGGIGGGDTASNSACHYTGQFYKGLIDNVRYYGRAITSQDVTALNLQTPGADATDLVTNGSFELPSVQQSSTFDTYLPSTSPGLSGWTVIGDSIDLIEGYWQPYDGAQSVDVDGLHPGGVSQVLPTQAGQPYVLTFAYSRNSDHCTTSPSMTVTWGGTTIGTYTDGDNNSKTAMQWHAVSVPIQASTASGPTTLAFRSADSSGSACGIALDDVSVTPQGQAISPTISTTPTGPVQVGAAITDTATLSGSAPGAGGTITFHAYLDSSCTNPVYTDKATVHGDGAYKAAGFQATTAGTYYWTADYSGDPATGTPAVSEGCAGGESTTVTSINDAWTRAQEITLDSTGSGSASSSIDFSGEPRWYKFQVTPGSTVQVDLTGPTVGGAPTSLPASYNLSLFGDIGQEEALLHSSPPDLQELGAQTPGAAASPYAISPYAISPYAISPYAISPYAISPWAISPYAISPYAISPYAISPYAISPYAISPYAISPWAISPWAISPDAPDLSAADYDEAQILSLLGVSQNPGTSGQHVFKNVWNPQVDQVNASGPRTSTFSSTAATALSTRGRSSRSASRSRRVRAEA